MLEHTPGPWTTTIMHENSAGPGPHAIYAHGEVLGEVHSLADARLIAAAPEMLAFVILVANYAKSAWADDADAQRSAFATEARALLAKVEGKQ